MKRMLLLVVVAILCNSYANAQTPKLMLTPNGFVNAIDTAKDFIVVDIDKKSQSDLYKQSLIYFSSLYVSPNDVISKVENEVLTINAFAKGVVHENKMATPFDINYTIVFKFKDNKVKIERPSFRMTVGQRVKYLVYTGLSMNGQESGLYGKGGKIKSERGIADIEEFFNSYVDKYTKGISSAKSDW